MAEPSSGARAAGSILAIAIIAGAVAGSIAGQPSIGVIGGTAIGLLLLLVHWLSERRR